MKHIVITTLMFAALCFGANLVKAPKVEAVPITEMINSKSSNASNEPLSNNNLANRPITSRQGIVLVIGTEGKNIVFAEDGHSVAIIYGRYIHTPDNPYQVSLAYTTDLGSIWSLYGPVSTFNSERAYSAVDAEQDFQNSGLLYFAWHQAARISGNYEPSPLFYAKEVAFPSGLFTAAFQMPNSAEWDVWLPCIGVKDSFVIITAYNNGTSQMTYDCYIWRSTDFGETWDSGRIFQDGPFKGGPHFRFGSDGYMFFLWVLENYCPYYCESFDYGLTWTQPQPIWQDHPPYPNARCEWARYDCEVVRDTPVVTVGLDSLAYSLCNDIWVYRPDSGGPGSWRFRGTRLIRGDSTVPYFLIGFPNIAADDCGNIFIGYASVYDDSAVDFGLFARPSRQNIWYNWGMLGKPSYLELAHNAPLISSGDSTIIGMIVSNINLFDYIILPNPPIPGIAESNPTTLKRFEVTVAPNPFRNSVKFTLETFAGKITIAIFDVTGNLVRKLTTNNQKPTTELIWDGKKSDGNLANSGVYFYNISSGGNRHKGKVILTR